MAIASYNPGPSMPAFVEMLLAMLLAVVAGLALGRIVDHFLAEDDPRRERIGRAIVFAAAFVLFALMWMGNRD